MPHMDERLTETIVVKASLNTLKRRLKAEVDEKADRIRRRGPSGTFGGSLSDKWLVERIEFFEDAIKNYDKTA